MRKCGPCNVCCVLMKVEELEKPAGAICPNLGGTIGGWKRCMIYEERPQGCRAFRCEWLRGAASSKDRPDKSFIMAAFQANGEINGQPIGPTIVLTELREKAFDRNSACRQRYERLAKEKKYNVVYQRMTKDAK